MSVELHPSNPEWTADAWDIRAIPGGHDEGITITLTHEVDDGESFSVNLSLDDLSLLLRIEDVPPTPRILRLRGIRS